MASAVSTRVWVVTGANSGLGLAIAQHVLSQGDKVRLARLWQKLDISQTNRLNTQVIATVRDLRKIPESLKWAGVHMLVLDLDSCDEDIQIIANHALQVYGHVDVLVNNAAAGLNGPIEEQSYVTCFWTPSII